MSPSQNLQTTITNLFHCEQIKFKCLLLNQLLKVLLCRVLMIFDFIDFGVFPLWELKYIVLHYGDRISPEKVKKVYEFKQLFKVFTWQLQGVVWYRYQQTYQSHTSTGALYVSVCVFLAKETRILILELLGEPIFSYLYNVPHCLQTLHYYQGTLCICKMNDSVGVLRVTP